MEISFIINSLYHSPDTFPKILTEKAGTPTPGQTHYFTEHKGHAKDLARIVASSGSSLVMACGGDGTLHEVINGVMDENLSANKPAIGVYSLGTGNDFAKNFRVLKSAEKLHALLNSPSFQPIDIGRVEYNSGEVEYFHNEVSLGFGAEVIRQMELRGEANKSYLSTIFKVFKTHKARDITLVGDDFKWEGKAFLVVIANGKYMGGGLSIAPDAIPTDGYFNITIVGDVSLMDFIIRLPAILRARRLHHPQISYFTTRKLEIYSKDDELAGESDGELLRSLPSRITCLPSEIQFLS